MDLQARRRARAATAYYGHAVVATLSAPVRAGWWVASVAAHAAIWTVAGHSAREHSEAPSDVPAAAIIDVAPDEPAVAEDSPTAVALARPGAAPPAAPLSHVHPYPVAPDHDARPHDPSIVHAPFHLPLAVPPTVTPEAPLPVRFTMRVTTGADPTESKAEHARSLAAGRSDGSGAPGSPLPESDVSVPARLVNALAPVYPLAAREDGVEADVVLAIVVTEGGTVSEARVSAERNRRAGADFRFEEAALEAVRTARFTPALREGKPVAVRMRWTVSFRLR